MDQSKSGQQNADKRIVVRHLCAFCAHELAQGDHVYVSVESPTGLHFVVHLRCFRSALSEHNQHLLDIADIVVH
ncbi:MAG: hypothetical protein ACREND_08020 [Gemmatimonadaceae bacterium]